MVTTSSTAAASPAEGSLVSTDSPDFSAAVVIDLDSGEEMASYRARIPPEDFAYELAEIGHDYNDALIAVERNVGGSTIITLERECLYPNVYAPAATGRLAHLAVVWIEPTRRANFYGGTSRRA